MDNQMLQFDPSPGRYCIIGEADPFIALLLRRFVEKVRLPARRAQTGEYLLDLVRQKPPALIILDPELPGKMRGWDLCEILKSTAAACQIPVIVCSWLQQSEVQSRVGYPVVHLLKPELHFDDFFTALMTLGLSALYQDAD